MQQVPQIAPSLPEIRPAAPQRKGGDGFARLLDTMDAEPREAQQPSRARDMDDAEPVKTRRRADHAGRPHQPRTERQDAKDTNKTDSDTDQTQAADDTQTADATAADSQPKEHKGKDGKDTADTAVDPQAVTSVPADVKTAAVEAVVMPVAPADTNDAPVPPVDAAATGIEAVEPQKPAPQLPAQAAEPQTPETDAQPSDKQMADAAQSAKKNQAALPQVKDTTQAPDTRPAPQAFKDAAALNPQANDAAKAAAEPAPKAAQPVLPDQASAQAEAHSNVADGDPHNNVKQADTLESALAKQFGANVQVTDNAAVTLPDAARALQNHLTPASVTVQTSASAATNQPIPLQSAALAVEIASRAKDGMRQFEIRLDPPELGRVDVKLNVDKSGHVNTHLTVDRPETLDLLRRDSQGLERALQQAGLKTSDGNLEFSLRQQTPDGSGQRQAQSQQNNTNGLVSADADTASTVHAEYQWAARLRGGVDIRV